MANDLQASLGIKASPTNSHYNKDDKQDKTRVLEILRDSRPFKIRPGRSIGLTNTCHASILHLVDKYEMNDHDHERNSRRALNQIDVDFVNDE